jgi:hypothetical protein
MSDKDRADDARPSLSVILRNLESSAEQTRLRNLPRSIVEKSASNP